MAGPLLAPRPTFDCLWCGRSWTTRSADDLEGWAKLCPDCLGKAGENAFLRFRLRDALAARSSAERVVHDRPHHRQSNVGRGARSGSAMSGQWRPAAGRRRLDEGVGIEDLGQHLDPIDHSRARP
jgi:hypothetical protein